MNIVDTHRMQNLLLTCFETDSALAKRAKDST